MMKDLKEIASYVLEALKKAAKEKMTGIIKLRRININLASAIRMISLVLN